MVYNKKSQIYQNSNKASFGLTFKLNKFFCFAYIIVNRLYGCAVVTVFLI